MAPRLSAFDSTLAFLREGYAFIPSRSRRLSTDVFETRLLLRKTLCMTGADAAQVFYDTERFTRQGAAPGRVQKTLFGTHGVQGLDGEAHRCRKHLFMALMTPERLDDLAAHTAEAWQDATGDWATRSKVTLLPAAREVLCRAVCRWAGVPLPAEDVPKRAAQMGHMIEGPGRLGLGYWRSRWARKQAERWAGRMISHVREGSLRPGDDRAVQAVALHRGPDGEQLDLHTASVELLNVLRPTVAIARFVTFAALALHEHPAAREALTDEDARHRFVQEVRRYYPFFPFAGARVRQSFTWRGTTFPEGRQVLLDLYGTNREPGRWAAPDTFRPERFRDWDGSPFDFIPQGGGDHYTNHRCAGEWATIRLMEGAVQHLTEHMTYAVPEQDLRVRLNRMPAQPESGFVMTRVRAR